MYSLLHITLLLAGFSEALPNLGRSHESTVIEGLAVARRANDGNGGCPRPAGQKNTNAKAPLVSSGLISGGDLDCYYIADCPLTSLYDYGSAVEWRDFASGEGEILQYIRDAFNQDKKLSGNSVGLKTASKNNLAQAVSDVITGADGAFDCNLLAADTCQRLDSADDCHKYGAAGYNLIESFYNFYTQALEIQNAITQAKGLVDGTSIVTKFTVPSKQPPPLTFKQFTNIVLGVLGGFSGNIGTWAGDAKTIASLAVTHDPSKGGTAEKIIDDSRSDKSGNHARAAAGNAKPTPSKGSSPATTSASGATASESSAFNSSDTKDMLNKYGGGAINIISGVKAALPAKPNSTLNAENFLDNMVNSTLSGLQTYASAMLSTGQFQFPKGQTYPLTLQDGKTMPVDIMMFEDLMINGSGLVHFDAPLTGPHGLINQLSKTITAQMIQYVWDNSDGGLGTVPFVTWDDAPCGQVKNVYLKDAISKPRMQADVTQAQVTIDDKCYYLLGGIPGVCKAASKRAVGPPTTNQAYDCCTVGSLTGAEKKTLDGKAFAGLTTDDLIRSAVETWKANGKKNGGAPLDPASIGSTLPASVVSLGSSSIPLCDYRNIKEPGKGCPDLQAAPNCTKIS